MALNGGKLLVSTLKRIQSVPVALYHQNVSPQSIEIVMKFQYFSFRRFSIIILIPEMLAT